MAKKKIYDDDDGRTIADMSGIERQPLIIPRFKKKQKPAGEEASSQRPEWENSEMNKEQKRAVIGGTLGAALLVLVIFAVIIAAVIFLIGRFGH